MTSDAIELVAFGPEHLEGAHLLSQQASWPHRLEDWRTALALSSGLAAISNQGSRVVGTALVTPYGGDAATVNMVIVEKASRGHGLGRKLMDAALALAGDRALRLVATDDGVPLYRRLGFEKTGTIAQHQGLVRSVAAQAGVRPARPAELPAIIKLDHIAYGADRAALISHFAEIGSLAVLERAGELAGFAALRPFGRGEVIGPVVASDADDAKALIADFLAPRCGAFVRLDTDVTTGLGPWLAEQGLDHVDGGVVMRRPALPTSVARFTTFALANQALG
ncbi:MAG TPA: GNAT family N-acetyltransferase [Bradyrhizobium sp.]|nr:GNAT family N-acetyltransferase [Bradyrhizobium sp.]